MMKSYCAFNPVPFSRTTARGATDATGEANETEERAARQASCAFQDAMFEIGEGEEVRWVVEERRETAEGVQYLCCPSCRSEQGSGPDAHVDAEARHGNARQQEACRSGSFKSIRMPASLTLRKLGCR